LFKLKSEFEQHFTLVDIEEMMPFERTSYLMLIEQAIDKRLKEKNANKGKK
tara:strand:- start:43715 stop:43867 length:153 start_codon:yes stop_codon:yes gene_type:complete